MQPARSVLHGTGTTDVARPPGLTLYNTNAVPQQPPLLSGSASRRVARVRGRVGSPARSGAALQQPAIALQFCEQAVARVRGRVGGQHGRAAGRLVGEVKTGAREVVGRPWEDLAAPRGLSGDEQKPWNARQLRHDRSGGALSKALEICLAPLRTCQTRAPE